MRRFSAATVAGVLGLLAVSAWAAPVTYVSDDFADGSRTKAAGSSQAAWWTRENTSLSVSSGALAVDWTATGTSYGSLVGVFNTGSGVSLGTGVGDKLRFAFDIRFASANPPGELRFGLYNSNGTNHTADGNNGSDNDFGYRWGLTLNSGAAGLTRETGGNSKITNGGDTSTTGLASTAGTAAGALGNTVHGVEFIVTRTAADAVGLELKIDGTLVRSGTHTGSAIITTFHEFAFGSGSGSTSNTAGTDFYLDNVVLDNVPEPATMGLLLLGGVGALLRRR